MMTLASQLKTLSLAVILLTVSGCALSPQRVTLETDIPDERSNIGGNAALTVDARDARDTPAFGTRGGVYPDTALILPDNNLDQLLSSSLTQAFQQRGFNAFNPTNGGAQLDVRLTTLDYIPSAGSVVNPVEINAVLDVTAKRQGDTLVREYRHSVTHRQPFTPTAPQNHRMINGALNHLLSQLVNDPELLSFIGGTVADVDEADNGSALDVSPVPEASPLKPLSDDD